MKVRFLIIRFSSIGDMVLTTPVIRCIKNQFDGEVEIHFITKAKYQMVLAHNPHIDKLITIDEKVKEVALQLQSFTYDYILDLHNNLRSAQVKRLVKAPALVFNKVNLKKWLLVNFKVNLLPQIHVVQRYLEPLNPFDITYDGQGLDFFLTEEDAVANANLPEDFVAFCIGGTYPTKKLPISKIVSLCNKINLPIVLIGGPEDQATANEIVIRTNKKPLNFCGKLNIRQSAWVVSKATKVMAHDTGMMHIAAALKKPMVSVWGNTVTDFGMYPLYPDGFKNQLIAEVKNLPCRPCSKLGHQKCPKKHLYCMQLIDEQEIVDFIGLIEK